jgi:hypothetical protein
VVCFTCPAWRSQTTTTSHQHLSTDSLRGREVTFIGSLWLLRRMLLLHLRQSYYLGFRQFYCLLLRRSLLRAMTTASFLIWAAERIPCPDSCHGSKAFCLQFFYLLTSGGLGTLLHFTRLSVGPKNLSPGQGYFCYASPKSQYGPIRKSATNVAYL